MKKISLIALMLSAFILSPNVAMAKKHDDGYKPHSQQGQFKKGKNRPGKNKAHKGGGKHKNKHGAQKQKARPPHVAAAPQPRKKKSKSKRFKRFLKRTLRDFGQAVGPQNRGHHYNGRGRERSYNHSDDYDNYCLPKHKIRRRLVKRGWHDFDLIGQGPDRIRLAATNFNGRRFKIVVDRCNGNIIKRRPLRAYWSGGY